MRGFTLLVIIAAQHVAQKRANLQGRERDARACIFDGLGVGRQRGSGGPRLATLEQVAAQLQNASQVTPIGQQRLNKPRQRECAASHLIGRQ